jgi:hypothetical protein
VADATVVDVAQAVVTALSAVVANAYAEPESGNVKAMSTWPDAALLDRIPGNTFYAVIPGGEGDNPEVRGLPDSGTLTGRLPIEVYAARRVSGTGDQLHESPARWLVAHEVSVDIEQKLIAAENTKAAPIVTYLDGPLQVRTEWTEQWVIVQVRFSVRYRKDRTTR